MAVVHGLQELLQATELLRLEIGMATSSCNSCSPCLKLWNVWLLNLFSILVDDVSVFSLSLAISQSSPEVLPLPLFAHIDSHNAPTAALHKRQNPRVLDDAPVADVDRRRWSWRPKSRTRNRLPMHTFRTSNRLQSKVQAYPSLPSFSENAAPNRSAKELVVKHCGLLQSADQRRVL